MLKAVSNLWRLLQERLVKIWGKCYHWICHIWTVVLVSVPDGPQTHINLHKTWTLFEYHEGLVESVHINQFNNFILMTYDTISYPSKLFVLKTCNDDKYIRQLYPHKYDVTVHRLWALRMHGLIPTTRAQNNNTQFTFPTFKWMYGGGEGDVRRIWYTTRILLRLKVTAWKSFILISNEL